MSEAEQQEAWENRAEELEEGVLVQDPLWPPLLTDSSRPPPTPGSPEQAQVPSAQLQQPHLLRPLWLPALRAGAPGHEVFL